MTARLAWLAAFPHAEAARAVEAVHASWTYWAAKPRRGFAAHIDEPKLTRAVRSYASDVLGRQMGLLGYWGAEGVENEIDYESAEVLKETRTDILYAWNDPQRSLRLVFEFKKLNHTKRLRELYLGERGILRFVTGPYSKEQAVAVMAAILTVDPPAAIAPLRRALQHPGNVAALELLKAPDGGWLHAPSSLFPNLAAFDTEHTRPPELAPSHGTIRVAHLLLEFGYPMPVPRRKGRQATLDALELP